MPLNGYEESDFENLSPPRYETRETVERLNRLLNLPYREGMQDWDIELADAERVNTFCDLYETGSLNANEKFALMSLIVASLDDLLDESEAEDTIEGQRVTELLQQDFGLHFYTVEYWSLLEEVDSENGFAVTPLMRRVWQNCFKPEHSKWIETDDEP